MRPTPTSSWRPCVMSFFKDADAKQVDNNLQWGVEIDEALFRPEIPEGFQELSLPSKAQQPHT